jgi:hypothetical protein
MKILKVVVALIFLSSSVHGFSFRESGLRTSPSNDIFRRLKQHFSVIPSQTVPGCVNVDEDNKAFLGEITPADGKPIFENVSPAFINWYSMCINSYYLFTLQNPEIIKNNYSIFLSSKGVDLIAKSFFVNQDLVTGITPFYQTRLWSELSPTIQKVIQLHLIHSFIGPQVLEDEDLFIKKVLVPVVADQDKVPTIQGAVFDMVLSIMTQDEFLNF